MEVAKNRSMGRIKRAVKDQEIITQKHLNNQMRIVLVALFAGVIAAARLGQKNIKNLAEVPAVHDLTSEEVPATCDISIGSLSLPALDVECPCQFSELPGLGAGISQGYKQHAEASQVTELNAVPDTQFNQICQTNCCECAESAHAALAIQAKNRTFTIQGAISVLERVYLAERERAAENSESFAEKDTVCVTTNTNGGLGAEQQCVTVQACPPELSAPVPRVQSKGPVVKGEAIGSQRQ
jgi:hypothetical protein